MNDLESLKNAIEAARKELNIAFLMGDFESYYKKSKKLDQLIEQYIDRTTNRN